MTTDRDPLSEHSEPPENRAPEDPLPAAQSPAPAQGGEPGGAVGDGGDVQAGEQPGKDASPEAPNVASGAPAAKERSQQAPKVHVPKGAYHVSLESFEGPLDLLLHLIQQHELDITDIPIAFISEKYVEYLHCMQELNIDLASEYLVMAATLAHIKSKMLLPAPPAGQEDEAGEEIDPRSELIRRLLEYQKYKQASEQLAGSPVLGRDVFLRGTSAPEVGGEAPLAQLSIFKLFDAFQRMLGRVQQTAEHLIDVDRISISERIIQLTDQLKGLGRVHFEELFEQDAGRSELVVTFLALLEMTRLRMLRVTQEGPLEDIFVQLTISEEQEQVLRRDASAGDPLADLVRGEFSAADEQSYEEAARASEAATSAPAGASPPGEDEPSNEAPTSRAEEEVAPESTSPQSTSDLPVEKSSSSNATPDSHE